MKIKFFRLTGAMIVLAVFAGCQAAGTDAAGGSKDLQTNIFQNVSTSTARSLITDTTGLVVLDVRTPEEYAGGHLENAINIDYKADSFRDRLGTLDKNKPYLVYCRTGKRSSESVKIMHDLGFTNVINLTGGITQWQSDGGAISN